ncbi:MAG: glycerol-3-phosphate acyltransferase, partial [Desulfobacterales bacterium]|nr:glycerol-3-phosphate acyltransferase [Desulfobacterales bacterium]
KIKKKYDNIIDYALSGTHNYFLSYLPRDLGYTASLVFKIVFSSIKINNEQTSLLRKLPDESIVVYATKYKSYFEQIFYYSRYKLEGLPYPGVNFEYRFFFLQPVSHIFKVLLAHVDHFLRKFSFPNPYENQNISEKLLKGEAGLISLIDKKGFYRWFVRSKKDPVQYLIEMQMSIDKPIYIVPQLLFFSINPYRYAPNLIDILFGSMEKPGRIRRLVVLFKNSKKIFVEISEPFNLMDFLDNPDVRDRYIGDQALALRNELILQINDHRQSIIGPILKTREELKESVLTDDRLQNIMDEYSIKKNIPLRKIHRNADEYIDEIAANYNINIIKVLAMILKWVFNSIFEGIIVEKEELNQLKKFSKKGPLILVPCHKSHVDYLILSYIFHTNNMPCPHIAAGKNLSFWPLGLIFRGGGAFFIRRTFKGAELYSKVFGEYVYKILNEGFNVEFFIEGGRSRTGKLLSPKLGLLSILLNAYKNGACKDMNFVPIYVGYDRVLEESSYLDEIEGGKKEPESLKQVIRARKFLRKRYGKIYIRFHEPISLNEHLARNDKSISEMNSKEFNKLCRYLGNRFVNSINDITVATPYGIVAGAILNCAKQNFTYDFLISHITTYFNYLISHKVRLADTLVVDPIHAFDTVLESFHQSKFIEIIYQDKEKGLNDATIILNNSKRPSLEYYKNNCANFFMPGAFTALAILEKDAFIFSSSDLHQGYDILQDLFSNEFILNVDRETEYFVRKNLKVFIDEAILIPDPTIPDTYNITSTGFRKLKFFAAFLKIYFESYSVVLKFFMQHHQNSISQKERIKKIQAVGEQMYKNKEIEQRESLSKINYINAEKFFTSNGVKTSGDKEKIDYFSDLIQKNLGYL